MQSDKKNEPIPEQGKSGTNDLTRQEENNIPENNKTGMPPQPLFGEQGEEYLREGANLEDMPDEQEDTD